MKLSLIVAFFVPAAAHKMITKLQEGAETVNTTWTQEVGKRCIQDVLRIRTSTTPDQCRALCLADPRCISYDTVSTAVTYHSTWCIPNCPGGSCNDLCTASIDTPRALTSAEINNCGSCDITNDVQYYRWVRNPAPVSCATGSKICGSTCRSSATENPTTQLPNCWYHNGDAECTSKYGYYNGVGPYPCHVASDGNCRADHTSALCV